MRINIDEEDELKSIFEANKSPQRIIELLSMIGGEKIELGKTLIINVRKISLSRKFSTVA